MNDRTIEDLLEEYHATKQRQATAKNTLKRPLPTPPLPVQVKQQLKQKKQPIDKKRRKLSPNVYVSHYFQRGCKSNTHSGEPEVVEIEQPPPCQSSPSISHRQVVKFDDIAECYCVICCQTFDKSKIETEILEPCNHTFHRECIVRWKTENNSCPMCRSKITTKVTST